MSLQKRASGAAAKLCLALILLTLAGCAPGFETNTTPDEAGQESIVPASPETLEKASEIAKMGFESPQALLSDATIAKYSYVDPTGLIPKTLLNEALAFYDLNLTKIANRRYLSIVDFTQFSGMQRFHRIDMQDGSVWSGWVAHGSGSDPSFSGYATKFSNTPGSNATSLGFYLTAETYSGAHGLSLRLDGLSTTNSNVRARAIVVHGADYVHDQNVKQGRSWGCFAFPMNDRDFIVNSLKGGSLIYAGLSADRGVAGVPAPTPPVVTPTPVPSPAGEFSVSVRPLWETVKNGADALRWTQVSMGLVSTYGPNLLKGTADIKNFCPRYAQLNQDLKLNFWVYLISAVTKYESGFNPVSRMRETGMGTDPITKLPVYSEGLLQLSYQDKNGYPFCNEFDWSKDKSLDGADPRKTILDPIKNLTCGVRIMNQIMGKHNAIAFDSGNYWSTLMPSRGPEKSILALVKKLPFCNN
jgi:hypothetical protein